MILVILLVLLLVMLAGNNRMEAFNPQPLAFPQKYNMRSSYEIYRSPCSVRHDGYGFFWDNRLYNYGDDASYVRGRPYCDFPSKGYHDCN